MSLLANRFNHSLDRFFSSSWDPFEFWYPSFKEIEIGPSITTEVGEDCYTFKFETPGYKKGDIKVYLDGRILKVEGSKKVKDSEYSFSKSYWLKEGIKPEDLKAQYKDGVLSVKIPKTKEVSKKLEIEIQ